MSDMKNVTLVLSDGTKFHGKSFGYDAPVAGEVVFNTAIWCASIYFRSKWFAYLYGK